MKKRERKTSVADRIIEGLAHFAGALENQEAIGEKFTCRVVELDLRPTPFSPDRVRETRALLQASQAVFACLLGVSAGTVQSWEQGINPPIGIACRFMDEIRRNPGYW